MVGWTTFRCESGTLRREGAPAPRLLGVRRPMFGGCLAHFA